jgi:hypothetical protein
MANEERRAAAGTSAAAGKPGPGAEERCALCVMGREAEAVLGPLLLFEACDPKKPGRWPVHSLCAQWAPQAYYSEEVRKHSPLPVVPVSRAPLSGVLMLSRSQAHPPCLPPSR